MCLESEDLGSAQSRALGDPGETQTICTQLPLRPDRDDPSNLLEGKDSRRSWEYHPVEDCHKFKTRLGYIVSSRPG